MLTPKRTLHIEVGCKGFILLPDSWRVDTPDSRISYEVKKRADEDAHGHTRSQAERQHRSVTDLGFRLSGLNVGENMIRRCNSNARLRVLL